MKLAKWAQKEGISYSTAYRWYQNQQLPENVEAYQSDSGTIIVKEKEDNMLERVLAPYVKNGLNRDPMDTMFSLLDTMTLPIAEKNRSFGRFKTIDNNNEYLVVGEIPGFTQDDVKITVKDNLLTISGKHEITEEEGKYFSKDSSVFNSSFTLPSNINTEEIHAEHENGVLKIKIPKNGNKEIRQIPIKVKPK